MSHSEAGERVPSKSARDEGTEIKEIKEVESENGSRGVSRTASAQSGRDLRPASSAGMDLSLRPSMSFSEPDSLRRWKTLQDELRIVFEKWIEKRNSNPDLWVTWFIQMCTVGNVLQLVCAALLVTEGLVVDGPFSAHSVVEGLTLMLSLILMLHLQRASIKRRSIQVSSRANRFLQQLQGLIDGHGTSAWPIDQIHTEIDLTGQVPATRSVTNVQVEYKEGLRSTHAQLLVLGDVLVSPPDKWLTDLYCEQIDHSNKFRVVKTPAACQLEEVLDLCNAERHESVFDKQYNSCLVVVRWILIAALVISIISSCIHLALTEDVRYFELLLVQHVNVVLPLLPLSISLLSLLLKVGCNAYLSSMIHVMQSTPTTQTISDEQARIADMTPKPRPTRLPARGGSFLSGGSLKNISVRGVLRRVQRSGWLPRWRRAQLYSSESTKEESDLVSMMEKGGGGEGKKSSRSKEEELVTSELFWSHFVQRIKLPSRRQAHTVGSNVINPYADLVETFGSATVLCFPDMDGVLADAVLSPKQIFLPKSSNTSESGAPAPSRGVVLELLADDAGERGSAVFEDSNRITQNLGQLKPLGLNCLLNTNSRLCDSYSIFVEQTLRGMLSEDEDDILGERLRKDAYGAFVSCDYRDMSHLLAGVIGFSGSVQGSFTRLLELHTMAYTSLNDTSNHHVMSVVVEDDKGTLQLFSKGSVEAVVQSCPQVWDGKELRSMTTEDLSRIHQHNSELISNGFIGCALAYVSLDDDMKEMMSARDGVGRCVYLRRSFDGLLQQYGCSDWLPENGIFKLTRVSEGGAIGDENLAHLSKVMNAQIFIGMLTMRLRPKAAICNGIEVLSEAGIRFVYFSDMPEPPTVAFGHQLGLWSDWNCCISLKDLPTVMNPRSDGGSEEDTPRYSMDGSQARLSESGMHASMHVDSVPRPRLPHGIQSIRKHIMEADDVPLRVSMFCQSDTKSTKSMMGILQEYGELIVCCGSSGNMHNISIFEAADMAVSVAPDPPLRKPQGHESKLEGSAESRLSSTFTSVPCTLNLRQGTPITQVIKIIRTSRVLLNGMRQALIFALDASLLLMFTALIGNCFLLPPVLDSLQVIFILLSDVPCIVMAVMLCGMRVERRCKEADPMKMKLRKGNKATIPIPEMQRYALYCFFRLVPTALIVVLSFGFTLVQSLGDDEPLGNFSNGFEVLMYMFSQDDLSRDERQRLLLATFEARQISMILTAIYLVALSLGCLHRTAPVLQLWRHCRTYWTIAALAVALLQATFTGLTMSMYPKSSLTGVPVWVLIFSISLYPFVIVICGELVRGHDRKKVRKQQQRLTLEFETLLGQTSPK